MAHEFGGVAYAGTPVRLKAAPPDLGKEFSAALPLDRETRTILSGFSGPGQLLP